MTYFSAQTLTDKGSGFLNEDALLLTHQLAGVFDGSTSLDGATYDGMTGGYIAAHTARTEFEKSHLPLPLLAEQANLKIRQKMLASGVDITRPESVWSTSAAVVRIHNDMIEWVQTGDSLILLVFEDDSHKLLVTDYDHDSETLESWQKISGSTDQTILDRLSEQIKKVRGQMNKSYGVLNGDPEMKTFLKSGTHSVTGVKHILLFTDGMLLPKQTPREPDNMDDLVSLFHSGGLANIKRYVRSIQKTDPDCKKYPRFKCHDDIASIALTISNSYNNQQSEQADFRLSA